MVAEALTNAAKHAQPTAIWVAADVVDGRLRLSVCDDGVGGADPAKGSGLTGLTERSPEREHVWFDPSEDDERDDAPAQRSGS